ncbi:hypothetical protein [Aerobium aerolatum]|uniref:Uncharacterized protein n=1 Tax=Aquamicrobium aerolatum DSM 21857 TaxID=1121003 RepID=A0A1I3JH23_9HYPH|nr:hypothetical protein [Aquamicrobium aerolatum]SFI59582.1 hypothetical protein SAMN03080618_00855 [Aquamicrobium aerolatum DSM 21857]
MTAASLAAAATGLPRDFTDLEDQVIRVKIMSSIANDQLQDISTKHLGVEFEKLCHLVRATNELAEQLLSDFYAVPGWRAAA